MEFRRLDLPTRSPINLEGYQDPTSIKRKRRYPKSRKITTRDIDEEELADTITTEEDTTDSNSSTIKDFIPLYKGPGYLLG